MAVALTLTGRIAEIDIEKITASNLLNFRLDSEQVDDFAGLIVSIRKQGLINPLLVREVSRRGSQQSYSQVYEIISGHRRFAACKKLGLTSVLCNVVSNLSERDAFEIALIDNIQRQSLTAIEEAEAFKSYVTNFGRGSISELAGRIGKSEEYVSHRLLLLGLPKTILNKIRRRLLKPAEATELVWLNNPRHQLELAEEITKHSLSFRQTRNIARLLKNSRRLTVQEAVEKVLASERTAETNASISRGHSAGARLDEQESEGEPWMNYKTQGRSEETKILDHATLMIRTCLAGLDELVEKAPNGHVRDFLMKERYDIHKALDDVIKYKINYLNKGKSLGIRN